MVLKLANHWRVWSNRPGAAKYTLCKIKAVYNKRVQNLDDVLATTSKFGQSTASSVKPGTVALPVCSDTATPVATSHQILNTS